MIVGKNGVTANTPKNIIFGAGTIHRGLKYTDGTGWNFTESVVGATSGGSKFTIKPEVYKVPVDGADVPVKGLNVKTGEEVTMEINLIELSSDIIAAAAIAEIVDSDVEGYDLIQSKPDIEEGDYWENIAFVGKMLSNDKPVIVIMDNALCTSGLESEGKSKESSVGKYTFECNADAESDMENTPWRIYYPQVAAA